MFGWTEFAGNGKMPSGKAVSAYAMSLTDDEYEDMSFGRGKGKGRGKSRSPGKGGAHQEKVAAAKAKPHLQRSQAEKRMIVPTPRTNLRTGV